MQEVQLVLADPVYRSGVRDALTRTGPWSISALDTPDTSQRCVIVMDEDALSHTGQPLDYPERVVLVTRKDPQRLSRAWDAGIVSVVSDQDPPATVLLAIMAAALRVPRLKTAECADEFSPGMGAGGLASPKRTRHH
jgi:hypothetical protein